MIYEYCCTNPDCKHEWEDEHSIKEAAKTICPKCKQETAKRLISKSSFILTGGGWASSGYS